MNTFLVSYLYLFLEEETLSGRRNTYHFSKLEERCLSHAYTQSRFVHGMDSEKQDNFLITSDVFLFKLFFLQIQLHMYVHICMCMYISMCMYTSILILYMIIYFAHIYIHISLCVCLFKSQTFLFNL